MSTEFKVCGSKTKREYTPVEIGPEFQIVSGPMNRGDRFLLVSDNKVAFEILAPGKTRDKLLAEYEQQKASAQTAQKIDIPATSLRKTDEAEISTRLAAVQPNLVCQPTKVAEATDEEAEQAEFLDAVATDFSWEFSPDDWYEAKIHRCDPRRQRLSLSLSDGTYVDCINSSITQAAAGHIFCIPKTTPALVRVEKHGNRYRAIECRLESDEPIRETRETLVVQSWAEGRTFGTGIRPCGCPVFATTSFRGGLFIELREGDIVEANIGTSERKPGLAMARVVSIKNDEGRSDGYSISDR